MFQNENKIKDIQNISIQDKLAGLEHILHGLNAHGSIDLIDLYLIVDYLKGAFGYVSLEEIELDED